jgi:hypothetical protein
MSTGYTNESNTIHLKSVLLYFIIYTFRPFLGHHKGENEYKKFLYMKRLERERQRCLYVKRYLQRLRIHFMYQYLMKPQKGRNM